MNQDTNNATTRDAMYTNKTVNLLADGLVQLYKPSLTKSKQQLGELTEKQNVIIEQLHNENMKLAATQYSIDLQEIMSLIKVYNGKLQSIKKSMMSLHERSIKLKKRSLRLQHFREKELYVTNKLQLGNQKNPDASSSQNT